MRQCCKDHNGNRKQKYKTQEEAENSAVRRREMGVTVFVYLCEDEDGWHLTSQNSPPLERPIREMTIEERKLYTKNNKNLLGSYLDEELLKNLKDESEKNTLAILKRNVEQAQQEFSQRKEIYQNDKNEFLEVRKRLRLAEQGINEAKQRLLDAQNEYDSAKRRIERKRRRYF